MRLRIALLIFLSIVVLKLTYGQKVMEFIDVKKVGDMKTVYFQIQGLDEDEQARQQLLDELISDENVLKGRIFTSSSYKTRCQLYLPMSIGPEYIRPILQSNGYDFEFSSVSYDGKLLEQANNGSFFTMFYKPSEDFPEFEDTGDKEKDDENYRIRKEAWINSNHRKYSKQKSNGTAEYPIVITQEQFDSFTEEKQEKVLAQPDVFEIR